MSAEAISREELETLVRQQAAVIERLEAENHGLREEVTDLRERLEVMHYRVAQMSRRIYGNTSERMVDADQQTIPGVVPSMAALTDNDDDDDDPDGGGGAKPARTKKQRRGRLKLPEHLPREDRVIEPDTKALRSASGAPVVKLREEVTEKLDYVAGGFRVIRVIRPVYGVPHSDETTISATPPAQVVDRGLPTDRLVAMVLCDKFDLHTPLYRQQQRFARAGIDLPRSTLANWIGAATRVLSPVLEAIAHEVHDSAVIGLDDTIIERLQPGLGRTHTGRFWGYATEQACCVRYGDNRTGSHPKDFLDGWSGAIVADAYNGHEALYKDGSRRHIPCMAHVRRKFVEAYRDGGDHRAKPALDRIRDLYAIEKEERDHAPHVIKRRRKRDAVPILKNLRNVLDALTYQATPSSPLGKACTYLNNLWPRIDRYTTDGRYPIDNNAMERLWKPVALGRKNYLFVGSELGGQRAADAYSIVLSCRLNGIDPYRYLCDTFAELHDGRREADELTPAAWAQQQRVCSNAA